MSEWPVPRWSTTTEVRLADDATVHRSQIDDYPLIMIREQFELHDKIVHHRSGGEWSFCISTLLLLVGLGTTGTLFIILRTWWAVWMSTTDWCLLVWVQYGEGLRGFNLDRGTQKVKRSYHAVEMCYFAPVLFVFVLFRLLKTADFGFPVARGKFWNLSMFTITNSWANKC